MSRRDGFFQGSRAGPTYYQGWLPDGQPRAVLLLVHGLAEHSGRYANLAGHFVPLGHAVYGIDHVGHGKSGGRGFSSIALATSSRRWMPSSPWCVTGTLACRYSWPATAWAG